MEAEELFFLLQQIKFVTEYRVYNGCNIYLFFEKNRVHLVLFSAFFFVVGHIVLYSAENIYRKIKEGAFRATAGLHHSLSL